METEDYTNSYYLNLLSKYSIAIAALEDIASGDETSTIVGAITVAKDAIKEICGN